MFKLVFILSFQIFGCDTSKVIAYEPKNLVGEWDAIGYFAQDDFVPAMDPNFHLKYEFLIDGTSIMSWEKTDTKLSCKRKGNWSIKDEWLIDETIWIDPSNSMTCSSDPDMEPNKITWTEFLRCENLLFTKFPFINDYLIYVWEQK